MELDGDGTASCHERARRAVFGFLAASVLHETNNVLTVMAGVRQLLRAGQTLSERVGGMIDHQLARMEELVEAIRRIGPDDGEARDRPRDITAVLDAVDRIVQLAGKGRGIDFTREAPAGEVVPSDPEAMAVVTLLTILPCLPPRGRSGRTRVTLRGSADDGEVRIGIELDPATGRPADEPESAVARALIARVGGRLEIAGGEGTVRAVVAVPREGDQ